MPLTGANIPVVFQIASLLAALVHSSRRIVIYAQGTYSSAAAMQLEIHRIYT